MDPMTLGVGALFVFGTIAVALLAYSAMRAIVGGDYGSETQDLAGSVIFRVSALHGLILALIFAQEIQNYNLVRNDLVDEATAIADIYNDIHRYGAESEGEVHAALSAYVRVVVDEEWPLLAESDRLAPEGWRLREIVYQAVLDLVPSTPREEALRHHMIDRAQAIATLRQERENSALNSPNGLFWFAALSGVVLVTLPYFIFSPTRLHLMLLSVYGGFSGIVMFIIYAISDPFSAPGALAPVAFERLLETEIGDG
ncbi:DUF4239 domain-containing protein [Defluviimonas sp. WL0024]|uniref:DUF4239 domain-containing protein n=2 Tax=Albidovulum TaxID=205889 RepID=A0ABT3J668_9RHOB|nr:MULTISPECIES: DUF4239 domain-containing protein [Defluviimonas]MCU9849904.1 DUF4239 domain-containing protein [Defluviimonas sp. WL0024]MCW3783147.1 DUF4239 domain-containing protein [Defluviimonas salinarum]